MIAILDVDYRADHALAACVVARDWTDESPTLELVERIDQVNDYEPGQFYKRELPCLLAVLNKLPTPPDVIVIDGYVWLGAGPKPGLGAHLFLALEEKIPVIGVAKTRFLSAVDARELFRRGSSRALYVSVAGVESDEAVKAIDSMHGEFRLPTLLKRVDRLCRDGTG
jgi:deoxyribonuclease V